MTASPGAPAAHRLGSCVVAVFTGKVAEKAARAADMARKEGHPLTFTTEPEESAGRGRP